MSSAVVFDISTGDIRNFYQSIDPSLFLSRVDVAVYSDRTAQLESDVISLFSRLPIKYLKCVSGVVSEKTQAEKDATDAAILAEKNSAKRSRLDFLDDVAAGTQVSDFSLAKIDAAIDSISNLNEAKVFFKRLVRFIIKVQAMGG